MEFPLKVDFFPPVRVTNDERHRYVAAAEYSVHVLHKLVTDDKWKRISESKGVTVGKVHCIEEQGDGTTSATACMIMCASVSTTGTVAEVLEAIASPVTEDYRRAMDFMYKDRFIDGMCLHTISPRGSRNTQAFTTIKWAAFKDGAPHYESVKPQNMVGTDYCFLEHSGMQKEPSRDDSFGFCIQESIVRKSEVPAMAGFGLGRGELHRTGILIMPTDRKDVIQISSILQMDTDTAMSKAVLEKLMVRRVSAVANIPLLLDRRRLSRMQFLPRDRWVRDHERRSCVVCTKSFGLRRKHHCRNCGEVVCATCAPPREVDVSAYGVAMIRICTGCVVQSRARSSQAAQEEVLVYHVRNTLTSQTSHSLHSDEFVSDDVGLALGDDLSPEPRKSSSSDSNFSISSEEDFGFERDDYEEDSHVGSIAPDSPGNQRRYSEYSDARSSDMSFSDLNTLSEDALRITSVPPRRTNPLPVPPPHSPAPPQDQKPVKHTLYVPDDVENKRPNHAATMPEYLDEWRSARPHKPVRAAAAPIPRPPPAHEPEYMDDWTAPRAPSHTSSNSTLTRESMDEWCPPRRRDRNHSHVSSTSSAASGHESKRSSSSVSSSDSLVDMLASIREIKADLTAAGVNPQPRNQPHYYNRQGKDVLRSQVHEPVYMERLSEQLRDAELPGSGSPQRELSPPPPPPPAYQPSYQPRVQLSSSGTSSLSNSAIKRAGNRSSENASQGQRNDSSSMASTVDIDSFDLDSFSLICPETLQRQRQSNPGNHQDAGEERRSSRVSNLSASTVLEDVDDMDSMRQSELLSLRQQVEGLHKSLEDATNKLNYFTARSMVKQQVDTLEREVEELETTERRQRKLSNVKDPVVKERKKQYHALIDELHEIMGLPALSTRPRSQELMLNGA